MEEANKKIKLELVNGREKVRDTWNDIMENLNNDEIPVI